MYSAQPASLAKSHYPGVEAWQEKGLWRSHKWLILRRLVQLSIIAIFLAGPLFGLWFIKGNMSSSVILETLHLSDPFVVLQSVFAGHIADSAALWGALLVALFYFVVGGRVYCSWVCPINMLTDLADALRRYLNIKNRIALSKNTRYVLLICSLLMAAIMGMMAWELINPVTLLQREIVFGFGISWLLIAGIFFLDSVLSKRAWCSKMCPMGAFYSLLGAFSLLRVNALKRHKCNDCMDCFVVCPEPQVISPALKGTAQSSPVILSVNCTNCGRCIDVCSKDVFSLSHRFKSITLETSQREVSL